MAKNLSCTQCSHYWIIAYKAVFVEVEYSASGGGSWQLITLNIKEMEG